MRMFPLLCCVSLYSAGLVPEAVGATDETKCVDTANERIMTALSIGESVDETIRYLRSNSIEFSTYDYKDQKILQQKVDGNIANVVKIIVLSKVLKESMFIETREQLIVTFQSAGRISEVSCSIISTGP